MRAQVTAYILIGLLIVLVVGIVMYSTQVIQEAPIEAEIQVPADIKPVYDQITFCMGEINKEALTTLGLQGGYIKIPPKILKTRNYITLSPITLVPYWQEDSTPSLDQIRHDMAIYVQDNIQKCLPEGTTALANATPTILFTEKEVITKVKWPVQIILPEKIVNQEEFAARTDVQFKKMYELALKTAQSSFFENLTINIISADKNIPTDGFQFSCKQKVWPISQVKQTLQEDIYNTLPRVRVKNTNHAPFDAPEETYVELRQFAKEAKQKLYNDEEVDWPATPDDVIEHEQMYLDPKIAKTGLKAVFQYQTNWPMEFSAKPHDGNLLKSGEVKGPSKYLRFMCINQWHFTYDVTYPVMGTIFDSSALNGEGYAFQYAFPVMIRDNAPVYRKTGVQPFKPEITEDFCTTYGKNQIEIRTYGFQGDIVATELEGTNITYECINQACNLGKTKSDNGIYRLRTALPQGCTNPFIIAEHEGYLLARMQATKETLDMPMIKTTNVKYEVQKTPYDSIQKTLGMPEPLLNERVIIHIGITNTTNDQYFEYPSNDTIYLVDGQATYDIDAFLYDKWGKTLGAYMTTTTLVPDGNTLIIPVIQYLPVPQSEEEEGAMIEYVQSTTIKPTFR